jgi:hypothetical protein
MTTIITISKRLFQEMPMESSNMNVYVTRVHQRPLLSGVTESDTHDARMLGFEVDLFLHPGGVKEWAICLNIKDNPSKLLGWKPI